LATATEDLLTNDYASAANAAAQLLSEDPTNADAVLLCALCLEPLAKAADLHLSSGLSAIVESAREVLSTGERAGIHASELRKWAANLQSSALGRVAHAVTELDATGTNCA